MQNPRHLHANAIKDLYEKMEESKHKNNATLQQQQQQQQQQQPQQQPRRDSHEIRDPHGILDLLTSMRSRL
jgi:hypothetical protein